MKIKYNQSKQCEGHFDRGLQIVANIIMNEQNIITEKISHFSKLMDSSELWHVSVLEQTHISRRSFVKNWISGIVKGVSPLVFYFDYSINMETLFRSLCIILYISTCYSVPFNRGKYFFTFCRVVSLMCSTQLSMKFWMLISIKISTNSASQTQISI